MKDLSRTKIIEFLSSDVDEATFFGYDKSSLITLREYLEDLKQTKSQYEIGITEFIESINAKNNWVKNITPTVLGLSINGKNGPTINVRLNDKKDSYIFDAAYIPNIGGRIILQSRKKVIENSQEELIEIGKLVQLYNNETQDVNSVSEHFRINNSYDYTSLNSSRQFLFSIDRDTITPNDYMPELYLKYKDIFVQLTKEDKQKLLKKIMVKK